MHHGLDIKWSICIWRVTYAIYILTQIQGEKENSKAISTALFHQKRWRTVKWWEGKTSKSWQHSIIRFHLQVRWEIWKKKRGNTVFSCFICWLHFEIRMLPTLFTQFCNQTVLFEAWGEDSCKRVRNKQFASEIKGTLMFLSFGKCCLPTSHLLCCLLIYFCKMHRKLKKQNSKCWERVWISRQHQCQACIRNQLLPRLNWKR